MLRAYELAGGKNISLFGTCGLFKERVVLLLRPIPLRNAEYIVFEGQHSPQLMFVLVSEPNEYCVLEVRGPESQKKHIRTAYLPYQMRSSPPP